MRDPDRQEAERLCFFGGGAVRIENISTRVLRSRPLVGVRPRRRYEGKTVDTLAAVKRRHGRRISLDALAEVTLGRRTDHVVEGVPMLWRTGQVTRVLERVRSDGELARDLYLFGRDFGWVGAVTVPEVL